MLFMFLVTRCLERGTESRNADRDTKCINKSIVLLEKF